MSKEIKIKSNGLRNELKEIRKSIDKLTNVLCIIHDIKHTHNEEVYTNGGPCVAHDRDSERYLSSKG